MEKDKIVFYGLKSENYSTENKEDFVSFNCKTNMILLDTEEERQKYIDFLQGNCISFDITQEIMGLFNFKTKEDVYEKLKKEQENAMKRLKETMYLDYINRRNEWK